MKRLLKYLLFFVLTVAFWSGSDKGASSLLTEAKADISFDSSVYHTDFSPTDSELNLPRQSSFANSQRVPNTVRRTSSAHRTNVLCAKSGKIIDVGLRYFVQLQSSIAHSTLVEPSHRLLALGKLII